MTPRKETGELGGVGREIRKGYGKLKGSRQVIKRWGYKTTRFSKGAGVQVRKGKAKKSGRKGKGSKGHRGGKRGLV